MKKGWTTTRLIAAGSIGVLSLVLTLPASSLAAVSGVPLMGGFINLFLDRTLDALTILIIPVFGAATIERTIIGLLSIPTYQLGPPGFAAKALIQATSGLVIDVAFLLLGRNKRISPIISVAMGTIYIAFAFVFFARLFKVPGVEQTMRIFLSPLLVIGSGIGGGVCGYIGWLIYQRIKNTNLIKRIQ